MDWLSLWRTDPDSFSRTQLAAASRDLAKQVASRHPGRSVELRIPPFVAVQLGIGERRGPHTRGTPPAVVEMPATVFLDLAVGRISWDEALPGIAVSGVRADLSGVFPLC